MNMLRQLSGNVINLHMNLIHLNVEIITLYLAIQSTLEIKIITKRAEEAHSSEIAKTT